MKSKPAPIITSLGSLKDLLPPSKDFSGAVAKYYAACPHTDGQGICNGYGVCQFADKKCDCSCSSSYVESDGNCYPKCDSDCNGHGQCSYARCKCDVNGDGFGFKGLDCSERCGKKLYDCGSDRVWCVPGASNDCNILDPDDKQSGNLDCWCRGMTGYSDDAMVSTGFMWHFPEASSVKTFRYVSLYFVIFCYNVIALCFVIFCQSSLRFVIVRYTSSHFVTCCHIS